MRSSVRPPPDRDGVVARRESIVLRRAERLRDAALLTRWLSDSRVLEFYGGRDRPLSPEEVERKYFRPRHEARTGRFFGYQPCVVELAGQPVGFVQYYRLPQREATEWGYPPPGRPYAFDLFIGEPDLWGRGVGTELVRLVRDHLLRARRADRVLLDPRVENTRAVHVYEKAGFRRLRRLAGREVHEGRACDCWLMEYP